MARKTSLTSLKQISEINLTPLMDLTFILLITFIITFPLIEYGVPIDLPKARTAPLEAADAQSVSLNAADELFLNGLRVGREELGAALERLTAADPEVVVMVRADESIPYGRVVGLLRLLRDADVKRMSLVTREEE